MIPVVEFEGVRVFHGDCREVLRGLPDNSVDSIVTDPPYELGFMGKKWDSSGIAYDVTVWAECLRVLKPGGHLLAFGGSRTFHRLGVAIEDAGFEIRDTIAWISSKTFPKSLNVSKAIDKKLGAEREITGWVKQPFKADNGAAEAEYNQLKGTKTLDDDGYRLSPITKSVTPEAQRWEGWGTGLKQVVEPVVMARKPLEGTVAENTLRWGVGGINIDASRVKFDEGEVDFSKQQKQGANNPLRIGGAKPGDVVQMWKPEGRWPANVILDEVSAQIIDEQSGENPSRFFYQSKASKRDRNEGLEGLDDGRVGSFNGNVDETPGRKIGANPDKPNLPGKNTHPTVKPTQLMRYLIKLVTPPGGTVLDPFTGSGSTGKAAILEGFPFVGVELTEDYLPIIEGRLKWARDNVEDGTLF